MSHKWVVLILLNTADTVEIAFLKYVSNHGVLNNSDILTNYCKWI